MRPSTFWDHDMDSSETKDSDPKGSPAPQGDGKRPSAPGDTDQGVWSPPSGSDEGEDLGTDPISAENWEPGEVETPLESIDRLEAEKADLTDRLVRVVADMDNLRKRTERDLADARKYSVSALAADMLSVGDNLQRALGAAEQVPEDAPQDGFPPLLEGVEMTARELDRVLEKHGINRIDAAGGKFDPHHHQAMYEVPNADVPSGTIVEVVQTGYMIGERVLRAALVGIAKGGPKETAPAVDESEDPDPDAGQPSAPQEPAEGSSARGSASGDSSTKSSDAA